MQTNTAVQKPENVLAQQMKRPDTTTPGTHASQQYQNQSISNFFKILFNQYQSSRALRSELTNFYKYKIWNNKK